MSKALTEQVSFSIVESFNTGRGYTREGQPIFWATFVDKESDTSGLVMYDKARRITCALPLPGTQGILTLLGANEPMKTKSGPVDQAYIMWAYDGHVRLPGSLWNVERLFELKLKGIGGVI